MTEIEDLREEIAALKLRLTETTTKDLSLVTLIKNWTGTSASCGLQEFLNSVDTTADLGNWDEKDKVRVATLKLVDTARSFYDATPELHQKEISWTDFKNVFLERFKDSRTDQFLFSQLHSAQQGPKETVRDFADRVRNLARQVTPQTNDPEAQRLCNLQTTRMMIASFINGLRGNPGIQTRFASPSVMEDAVRIAVTIEQAESCKGKSETFYVDSNTVATERSKPSRSSAKGRNPNTRTENSLSRSDFRCYECEGKGHYASICPTRKLRLESEKKGKRISDKVPETPNKKQPSRGKWRGNRQLRKPSENS
jgi:hypothetical protein